MKDKLGTFDAVAIIVGIVLGSGIFVAPAGVALASGGLLVASVLWIAGAAIASCGALSYAECASRLPKDGGFFVYYRSAYGPWLAFTGGWAAQLVTYPASIAAIAHVCAQYIAALFPGLELETAWVAIAAIALSGGLNGLGLKSGAWAQRVLTAVKVIALSGLCVAAVWSADGSALAVEVAQPENHFLMLLAALPILLWAYDGWSDVSMIAGAVRDPGRTLVRAVVVSMVVLAGLYIMVQWAVLLVLPLEVASHSESVFADAARAALGPGAGRLVAALVVVSTFGSLHGVIFTVSRLGSSMAQTGDFFRWFAPLDVKRGVPLRSLGLIVAASCVYAAIGNFQYLLALFTQTVWIFYGLTGVALLLFRMRGTGAAFAVKVPTAAPLVLIAAAVVMTGSLAHGNPSRFFLGLSMVSLGIPVFLMWRRFGVQPTAES
ncbi:MAG: amino acid permease [Myxococcota bacterium]